MKRKNLFLIVLLCAAVFFRIYKIGDVTEFLGDQGRTGLIIYEAWQNKTFPIRGPTVLTGQYLGPVFYYIVAPSFILSGFNPIGPALFMVILGVFSIVLFFYISVRLFSRNIALLLTSLYAFTPYIIKADQTLWEPNVIPVFVLLFIFSVYKLVEEKKFLYFILLGATTSTLIQLHYPNVFFILLNGAVWIYLYNNLISESKKFKDHKVRYLHCEFWKWSIAGVLVGIIIFAPFLVYEFSVSFRDIREIILIYLLPKGRVVVNQPFMFSLFDYSLRIFGKAILIQSKYILFLIEIAIIIAVLLRKRFWNWFFALWFIIGISAMSLYTGFVHDHYLHFLLPVPYFLIGLCIECKKPKIPFIVWVYVAFVIMCINISKISLDRYKYSDISRVRELTDMMIKEAESKDFSFTLSSSRSFSDLHYRYFFALSGVTPKPILSGSYDLLYIICEKPPCETALDSKDVQALCYDPHCEGAYPVISLDSWRLSKITGVKDSALYEYIR